MVFFETYKIFAIIILSVVYLCSLSGQPTTLYDIVLNSGRVIDPETNLDGIRNVGILNGKIEAISTEALSGNEIIDVTGLVVSAGFIDLHVHGITNKEQEYQVRDGVTTALELEWGVPMLKNWYESRESNALINYGASVNWPFDRFLSMDKEVSELQKIQELMDAGELDAIAVVEQLAPSYSIGLTKEESAKTILRLHQSLQEGGIGIGVPIGYLPGASEEEVFRIYQLAGMLQVPIFSHIRTMGLWPVQQAIADAMLTNAPLHIVHINSMALGNIEMAIEMVAHAQSRGFDITTELYPYIAASTSLQSAIFSEGWQDRLQISYGDLQWVATGERLTEESYNKYRAEGGTVIIHMMKPEWIKSGMASPGVLVASDGMPYAPLAHPRTAGTFSRVLGKYVREEGTISLNEAIEKMTLLPAKRLEKIAPVMFNKGRLQVGRDADITIFNPQTVIDKATFERGLEFSDGIEYVLVNGVFVVKDGKTVKDVFPGQAIYGRLKK